VLARSSQQAPLPTFEVSEQAGKVGTMRQQQITKRTTRPIAAPLDLRTPTGRRLPF
jgi:hypothetical protein